MQVVILAAGRGTRLPGETPKILREINGKALFRRALEQAAEVSRTPIVVCQAVMLEAMQRVAPMRLRPSFSLVHHIQQGAALSLLTAAGNLQDSKPVMVMDCDTIFASGVLMRFAAFAQRAFTAGKRSVVLTFVPKDDSARYSFAAVDTAEDTEFPHVAMVVEKQRISNVATCGVHAFATWEQVREAIYEMVILRTMTNGEYYLAPAHNNIVGTTAMLIEAKEFTHVGTPAELEAYERAVSKAR